MNLNNVTELFLQIFSVHGLLVPTPLHRCMANLFLSAAEILSALLVSTFPTLLRSQVGTS